jgi:magnesium transporter
MVKKRVVWLTLLFFGQTLTAFAMGFFEAELSRAIVLSMFIPLIISSGGNSGSQASTLVIRAMALGEVDLMDWWKIIKREVFSGLSLGLILGSIGFFHVLFLSQFISALDNYLVLIGLTVAFSLVGIVLWGTLLGSMLPLILKSFGLDPATSSTPLVATMVDVTGLIIYFTVSMIVLSGTLL